MFSHAHHSYPDADTLGRVFNVYTYEDYFGISPDTQALADAQSPESPSTTYNAGQAPTGGTGTVASFTDWRRSPTFWLAVFAVFALGLLHAEGTVKLALK